MKKLIMILGVLVCVVALILTGVTIAWFTDTKQSSNVFTAGDVKIRLTELDDDEEMFEVTNTNTQLDYGHIYPGRIIRKDATITNIGSEDAYIAAEIVIIDGVDEDINSVLSIPGTSGTGVTPLDHFFSGGVWGEEFERKSSDNAQIVTYESENYIVQYDTRMTDGFWITVFIKNPLESGQSLLLWKDFLFPSSWGNEQLMQCDNLRISTKVFAAQTYGFEDCQQAITTSFGSEFGLPVTTEG